jgi:enoyl-[acyl-carrier protein] reductase I
MINWTTNEKLSAGKGATMQQFVATIGRDKFEIDVAPWGEGDLKINGQQVAHLDGAKNRYQAFRSLKQIAERYRQGNPRD